MARHRHAHVNKNELATTVAAAESARALTSHTHTHSDLRHMWLPTYTHQAYKCMHQNHADDEYTFSPRRAIVHAMQQHITLKVNELCLVFV